MTCGSFTFISILKHYTRYEYVFEEVLWLSVFTGIGFSAWVYWWVSRNESNEDEVAAEE